MHISGKEDPYKLQAKLGKKLCEPTVSKSIEHGGSHQVPRATKDVKKIVQGIEWAMQQAATTTAFQY